MGGALSRSITVNPKVLLEVKFAFGNKRLVVGADVAGPPLVVVARHLRGGVYSGVKQRSNEHASPSGDSGEWLN